MKQSKKAGIVGACISLSYFISHVYLVFRNNKNLDFIEFVLPELQIAVINLIPLIAPAIVLLLIKSFKKENSWIFWAYPIIIGLGLLSVLLSGDPLAAGMLMIGLVYPLCIIYTIVLLFLRKKS